MKTLFSETSSPPRNGIKIGAIAICLAGAFVAALYLKQSEREPPVAVIHDRPPTAAEILAAIPAMPDELQRIVEEQK